MPPLVHLTSDALQVWRHCPRRWWRDAHAAMQARSERADSTPDASPWTWPGTSAIDAPATLAALRANWPHARYLPPPTCEAEWQAALTQTQNWLAEGLAVAGEGHAIFGACVASRDGARARIDVLSSGERGLRIGRLRLATAGDDDDVDAIAWWAHVAAHAGLAVTGMVLMLIEQDFVYPGMGCMAGVFREVDVSPVMGSRDVAGWMVAMRQVLRGDEPPLPAPLRCVAPGEHERCPHLAHCGLSHRVHDGLQVDALEVMGREVADVLRAQGHRSLATVPEHLLKDERRQRAWRAIRHQRLETAPDVQATLSLWPRPWFILRMDTIGHALPIWTGTRPYQMVPFQWACDEVWPPDLAQPVARHHFLASGSGDPRPALLISLLKALGNQGTIVAYNAGFERNRLRELARFAPDQAHRLEALQPRIVDLFQTLRHCAYHPAMRGSWSFKSVCQAFSPELTLGRFSQAYATAAEAYAHSMQDRLPAAEVAQWRQALQDRGATEVQALRQVLQALLQA